MERNKKWGIIGFGGIFLALVAGMVIFGICKFNFVSDDARSQNENKQDSKDGTFIIEGKSVTLVNGVSEEAGVPGSASKIITRYFGNDAIGDLNNDGLKDIAFLLTQDGGGSGIFYYIVTLLSTSNGYRGTNAIFLGDRIAPQTTEIRDGKIVVNYAERKTNEPMSTAPSLGVSKYIKVEGEKLIEVDILRPEENLWKIYSDTIRGISFRYPDGFSTTYIRTVDWPPQIAVLDTPFTCTEGGSEVARAGKTEKKSIDSRVYCVTKESEGAAGSIYTNYAYAFSYAGKTAIFTFGLRAVQCANFDDPQKTLCENERASFSSDGVIDRMARTMTSETADRGPEIALAAEYERLATSYDLKYKTFEGAVAALKTLTSESAVFPDKIDFYVPGKVPREDGNPYFIFRTVIDADKNDCLKGYMNLVSGAVQSSHDVCIIYN